MTVFVFTADLFFRAKIEEAAKALGLEKPRFVSSAEQAAKLAANGLGTPDELARLLHTERNSLWVLLAVCLVNVILAVWRPRILRLPVDRR